MVNLLPVVAPLTREERGAEGQRGAREAFSISHSLPRYLSMWAVRAWMDWVLQWSSHPLGRDSPSGCCRLPFSSVTSGHGTMTAVADGPAGGHTAWSSRDLWPALVGWLWWGLCCMVKTANRNFRLDIRADQTSLESDREQFLCAFYWHHTELSLLV